MSNIRVNTTSVLRLLTQRWRWTYRVDSTFLRGTSPCRTRPSPWASQTSPCRRKRRWSGRSQRGPDSALTYTRHHCMAGTCQGWCSSGWSPPCWYAQTMCSKVKDNDRSSHKNLHNYDISYTAHHRNHCSGALYNGCFVNYKYKKYLYAKMYNHYYQIKHVMLS